VDPIFLTDRAMKGDERDTQNGKQLEPVIKFVKSYLFKGNSDICRKTIGNPQHWLYKSKNKNYFQLSKYNYCLKKCYIFHHRSPRWTFKAPEEPSRTRNKKPSFSKTELLLMIFLFVGVSWLTDNGTMVTFGVSRIRIRPYLYESGNFYILLRPERTGTCQT
jgi:hypothetical protein